MSKKTDKADTETARLGGKIANAPTATNTGGFENRAVQGPREHTGMEGKNSGGFENRVIQEQGAH